MFKELICLMLIHVEVVFENGKLFTQDDIKFGIK